MVASEDSDMEESDVEDYPLDGKYRDELDRERYVLSSSTLSANLSISLEIDALLFSTL